MWRGRNGELKLARSLLSLGNRRLQLSLCALLEASLQAFGRMAHDEEGRMQGHAVARWGGLFQLRNAPGRLVA
eukprot:scaffold117165_cov26-Tisochrysis_lutea.AAC.4